MSKSIVQTLFFGSLLSLVSTAIRTEVYGWQKLVWVCTLVSFALLLLAEAYRFTLVRLEMLMPLYHQNAPLSHLAGITLMSLILLIGFAIGIVASLGFLLYTGLGFGLAAVVIRWLGLE